MSERGDAGTCNDAAGYSHQSITRRVLRAAGRRRAGGRAKTMARMNANNDWRRFTEQAPRTAQAALLLFMDWFENEMVVPEASLLTDSGKAVVTRISPAPAARR